MNYYDQGNEEEDAFEDGLWFAWSGSFSVR